MAEIGKLYTLAKDPTVSAYAMSDTCDVNRKKHTDWIKADIFDMPFMLIEERNNKQAYWIKILLGDQIGWINVEEEQLRLYKLYR